MHCIHLLSFTHKSGRHIEISGWASVQNELLDLETWIFNEFDFSTSGELLKSASSCLDMSLLQLQTYTIVSYYIFTNNPTRYLVGGF